LLALLWKSIGATATKI